MSIGEAGDGDVGVLMKLAVADPTWVDYVSVAGLLILSGLFILARERSRRHTLISMIRSTSPGTFVVDRRRGHTLMIARPPDLRPQTTIAFYRRQM